MTNSTETKPKPQKKVGPIRTGLVLPAAVFVLIAFLYFHFLFEGHVRKAIEWTGSYVHGAEVNVGSVSLSFLTASFRMRDLQVTDKEFPNRNLLQIGDIRFKFSWDALLRLKFLVEDAGVDGIQVFSERRKAGWVRPPEPPDPKNPSVIAQIEGEALNKVKDDYQGNILGDAAQLLGGVDEKELLKNIQGELKAEAKIKQLETELKQKEAAWKERFDNLPQKEEFERIAREIKAVDLNTKNPAQLAANIKKVGDLIKEADKKVDAIKSATKDLKADVAHYSTEINSVDDLIKQDINDIQKRLNIPDFETGDFSKALFAKLIATKLGSLQKYMTVARQYMPPPKAPGEKQPEIVPPARGEGKNYRFPVTKGYPLFWLKRATISSKSTAQGFSGDVAGQWTDVTTDPAIVGKPMVLDVKGDFPKAQIFGTHLLLTVDHVAEPKESLQLSVAQFPVMDFRVANDSNVQLAVAKATGKSHFTANLQNSQLRMNLANEFSQIDYQLGAKSSSVKEALEQILSGIPVITINANATGSWGDFDLHINSNLGKELSRGLGRYVQAKVDAVRAKIKAQVEDRVQGEKQKLTAEYNKIKNQVDERVKRATAEADKAKGEMKAQADAGKKDSKEKLKQDLKEKGKKLLKGLKR